jgi:hypothetical protein
MRHKALRAVLGGLLVGAVLMGASGSASAVGTAYVLQGQAVNFSDAQVGAGRYLRGWLFSSGTGGYLQVYATNAGDYKLNLGIQCANGGISTTNLTWSGMTTISRTCSTGWGNVALATGSMDDLDNF